MKIIIPRVKPETIPSIIEMLSGLGLSIVVKDDDAPKAPKTETAPVALVQPSPAELKAFHTAMGEAARVPVPTPTRETGRKKRMDIPREKRNEMILDHIALRGTALIADVAGRLGCAVSTASAWLNELEAAGRLQRTHKGNFVYYSLKPDGPSVRVIPEGVTGLMNVDREKRLARVMEIIHKMGGTVTGTDLAHKLNCSRQAAYTYLNDLYEAGKLDKTVSGAFAYYTEKKHPESHSHEQIRGTPERATKAVKSFEDLRGFFSEGGAQERRRDPLSVASIVRVELEEIMNQVDSFTESYVIKKTRADQRTVNTVLREFVAAGKLTRDRPPSRPGKGAPWIYRRA